MQSKTPPGPKTHLAMITATQTEPPPHDRQKAVHAPVAPTALRATGAATTRNGDRQNPRTKPAHRRPRRRCRRPGIGTCRSTLTRRERVLALQRTDVQQIMAEVKIGHEREALATRYLRHTALGGLVGRELDEARR